MLNTGPRAVIDPEFDPLQTLTHALERVQQLELNQDQLVTLLQDCQRLLRINQQVISELQHQTLINSQLISAVVKRKEPQ